MRGDGRLRVRAGRSATSHVNAIGVRAGSECHVNAIAHRSASSTRSECEFTTMIHVNEKPCVRVGVL